MKQLIYFWVLMVCQWLRVQQSILAYSLPHLFGLYWLPCGKRSIEVQAFCCDMPARSYILGTKGQGGFTSCTKCITTGVYLERRVCFHEDDDDYQIGDMSILTEIPGINMVDKFPNDYMHCVLLGCVRKIILLWLENIKNAPLSARLQSRKFNDITVRLLHLRSSITSDFARFPRELNEVMLDLHDQLIDFTNNLLIYYVQKFVHLITAFF
ncbi:Uncharacterized protein FWK35_00019026 [Aphis craccivora]|uniref:Uncharacterized protein n=1 Tax=Aphis craccivora TaxID=307492 RepID=A0A6G0Y334_APHCR|nr:Uncharacterized protein FWK35_00019026 [Aphis craccivora]